MIIRFPVYVSSTSASEDANDWIAVAQTLDAHKADAKSINNAAWALAYLIREHSSPLFGTTLFHALADYDLKKAKEAFQKLEVKS